MGTWRNASETQITSQEESRPVRAPPAPRRGGMGPRRALPDGQGVNVGPGSAYVARTFAIGAFVARASRSIG
eukprot:158015-Alexandrium_andersonii.AAC.1